MTSQTTSKSRSTMIGRSFESTTPAIRTTTTTIRRTRTAVLFVVLRLSALLRSSFYDPFYYDPFYGWGPSFSLTSHSGIRASVLRIQPLTIATARTTAPTGRTGPLAIGPYYYGWRYDAPYVIRPRSESYGPRGGTIGRVAPGFRDGRGVEGSARGLIGRGGLSGSDGRLTRGASTGLNGTRADHRQKCRDGSSDT
jgi:hypothetical protein